MGEPNAVSTLYGFLEDEGGHVPTREDFADFLAAFRRLLPELSYLGVCYLIGPARPGGWARLTEIGKVVSAFLDRYRFMQITLRPVHAVEPDDTAALLDLYGELLALCKPFQQEAYREQIISRLRVFPVLYFEQPSSVEKMLPVLSHLKQTFFLPSVVVHEDRAEEIGPLNDRELGNRWERISLVRGAKFSPEALFRTLRAERIVDAMLEDASAHVPSTAPLYNGSLLLDVQGKVRSCDRGAAHDLSTWFAAQEPDAVERLRPPLLQAVGTPPDCLPCLLPDLDLSVRALRMNREAQAWERLWEKMGRNLMQARRFDEAIALQEACRQGTPPGEIPLKLRMEHAHCLYEKGDLEAAMRELEEARRTAPDSPEVRYQMGLCEFGWRDYIEAADRFRESMELGLPSPLRREAEFLRGLSHYHLEEFDEAIASLERCRQAGKQDSTVFFYLGLSRLGKEEPAVALGLLREALSRGPASDDRFHVLFYIAHALKEQEEFPEAIAYCDRALQVEANSKDAFNLKGYCLYRLRRHEEAIVCFERAIEIDPDSAIDYANIGSNLRDLGDTDGAIAMYEKAVSLDPTIAFAWKNLHLLREKAGA